MLKKNSLIVLFLSVFIFSIIALNTVSASPIDPIFQKVEVEDIEIDLTEMEESQIILTEIIEKMNRFVVESAEQKTFASLHIDREEDPSGIVVFSFTEEPSTQLKEELRAIANDEIKLKLRLVQYTEQELMEKQRKIDQVLYEDKVLEEHEIQVDYTGVNVINNKLEIGISPFNEESVKVVQDYFSDDMIEIVEGMEIQLLIEDHQQIEKKEAVNEMSNGSAEESSLVMAIDAKENVDETEKAKPNIFKRFFQWLGNLFSF